MEYAFARFLGDDSAATAIEYGLIAALIAVAIVGSAGSVGTQLSLVFTNLAAALNK